MIKKLVIILTTVLMFISLFNAVQAQVTGNFETGGGGGGGGAGGIPISAIQKGKLEGGVNLLTPKILGTILGSKKFEGKSFFSVPPTLAAPLIAIGMLPIPTTPLLQASLTVPKAIPTSIKRKKNVEILAPHDIDGIHNYIASQVLEKRIYSGTVIIARRNIPADSMAALAYANYIDAAILLTEEEEIPAATLDAIKKLRSPNVAIAGGPLAVSKNSEDELNRIANVDRIWGKDRYETAVKVADKIKDTEVVVITDGTNPSSDALYVAIEYNAPIVYINGRYKTIPDITKSYLLNHKKTKAGEDVLWVVVGVDMDLLSDLKALYDLPEFLTKFRFAVELYKVGSVLFR